MGRCWREKTLAPCATQLGLNLHLPVMHLGDNDGRGVVYDRFGAPLLEEGETVKAVRKATALALFKGRKAEQDPWGGITLEWQVPTPPPLENFDEIPVITRPPYDFNPEEER